MQAFLRGSAVGLLTLASVGCGGFGGARTGPRVDDVDKIAYASSQGANDHRGAIRYVRTDVADALGPHEVIAGTLFDASWPAWRPDGTALAFSGWRAGTSGIFVVDVTVDGRVSSPPRRVHTHRDPNHLDKQMSWGTNGLIAFHDDGAIFTVSASTPGPAVRRTLPSMVASHPSWCADGELAFELTDASGTHVALMSRDFASNHLLTDGSEPSCSNRYFVLVLTRGNDIFYRDLRTGIDRLVVRDGSQPSFGPGSTQIAFVRGGQIWVCGLNGENAHAVTSGTEDRQPYWGRLPGSG
jgi:hypothetical protein